MSLSDAVRNATWEDAKTTFTDPALVAPPALELSIYKKVPSNKKRADARQGTIDQDPEFMKFLEGLANPTSTADLKDEDEFGKLDSKVTTTPLVEFLKEKKANKGRDSAKSSKHTRQGSGAGKGKSAAKDDESSTRKKGRDTKGDKGGKPARETVKILTKKAAAEQAAEGAKKAEAAAASASGADGPKSRRAGIAAAARLLQRDLGLSPGSAHRRARQDAAKAEAEPKTPAEPRETNSASDTKTETQAPTADNSSKTQSASTPPVKASSGRRTRGGRNADKGKATETPSAPVVTASNPPIILKKKPAHDEVAMDTVKETKQVETPAPVVAKAPPKPNAAKSAAKKTAAISSGATRGFIKHANPSQGITEPVLRETLQGFGKIVSLEIEKRKGFAYVEFAEHGSLVKAAAASPITVAQGAVQILERKDKKPAAAAATSPAGEPAGSAAAAPEKSTGRGRRGRGGGAGRGNAAANNNAQAAPAPSTNGGG